MNLLIRTFLLLLITVRAWSCGNRDILKACTCEDKVGYIYSPRDWGSLSCRWRIHADKKGRVVLLESEFLDIDSSGNCSSDYLEVFDGFDSTSPSLGRWCKGSMSVESSGRNMLVTYNTDEVERADSNAFKLTYKAIVAKMSLGTILALSIPLSCLFVFFVIFFVVMCRRKDSCGGEWGGGGGGNWGGGGWSGGGDGCGGDGGGCGGDGGC